MLSEWWTILPSAGQAIALLGAIAVFIWRKQLKSWPVLFTSMVGELLCYVALTVLLMHPHGHYNAYFYTYWISGYLLALLRLGIIADVMRSFPGLDFLPWKLYATVSLLGLTIAAASAYICYQEAAPFVNHSSTAIFYRDTAVLTNRCVNIACGTFGATVLGAIKLFRFFWSVEGARIAKGLFLRSIAGLIAGELYSVTTAQNPNAAVIHRCTGVFESLCIAAVFIFWTYSVAAARPERILENGTGEIQTSFGVLLEPTSSRER